MKCDFFTALTARIMHDSNGDFSGVGVLEAVMQNADYAHYPFFLGGIVIKMIPQIDQNDLLSRWIKYKNQIDLGIVLKNLSFCNIGLYGGGGVKRTTI